MLSYHLHALRSLSLLLIAWLFPCAVFAAAHAKAPACFSAAPLPVDATLPAAAMNKTQQQRLLTFLEQLNGDWVGYSDGFFCSDNPRKAPVTDDDYELRGSGSLERDKRAGHNGRFDFEITLESDNRYPLSETLQYNLHNGVFYFGLRQSQPVQLTWHGNNRLTVVELFSQRLKSGGGVQRLIQREITIINRRTIRIDNHYYSRGGLTSASIWYLRR